MNEYTPRDIENKWQKIWEESGIYKTPDAVTQENKMYILPQLPYPSGSGLHMGHVAVYMPCDVYARYQRMQGKKVLQVLGWDSFGLPAENYAIKTNVHPKESTESAINNFREQIKNLGISVDWDREVGSHEASYYKWTQWFFLLMYKQGLAYRKKQSINWCEEDKTVLANAQVEDGKCERCGTVVVQKDMDQWYLKITDYADKLLEGLDRVDWPEETVKRQKDWIGRSEGAELVFQVKNQNKQITVFTTRPDTLFGVTYMVLAPEHALVQELKNSIKNWDQVNAYIEETALKNDLDRQIDQEKTGVELKGIKAINPVNGEEISIWIADYVLASYGTGAIMAVPAHDERDFAFAKKFGLEMKQVVAEQFQERLKNFEEREGIYGILEKDEKILVMYEKHMDLYRLPGGTKEKNENDIETLLREFTEETGYSDVSVGRCVGQVAVSFVTSTNKVPTQYIRKGFSVSLNSEEKKEILLEEDKDSYEYLWLDKNDALDAFAKNLKSKINPHDTGEGQLVKFFFDGLDAEPIMTNGVIVNSEFLNGLSSLEAKEKIINWLEKNHVGQRKIQYKLRDWSVSRQRFWGAPTPMLLNEERKNKKYHYILVHGFTGRAENNFFPWLKQELEAQGHSVWCKTLPNSSEPNVEEQANFVLSENNFTENTVILGHSLGGPVVMHLLEKINTRLAKIILVDSFYHPNFEDKDRPFVEKSFHWQFDFEKIKQAAEEFVLLADSRYQTIPKEQSVEIQNILNARLITVQAQEEHFCANEEPAVLEHSFVDGFFPVPERDLPVMLPEDVDFKPTGESPLNYSKSFHEGVEEKYGKGWRREVDTLDTFMCSSWYYYRYLDPHNDKAFASPEALKSWMPVDFYIGGPEHVNGHLLYARFFTKVLYDAGYIDFDEPFLVHKHQGLILGPDNRKMSKRWGNVINPNDVVAEHGADTARMYQLFMGPLEETKSWNDGGVKGVRRFLDKVWKLQDIVQDNDIQKVKPEIHKLIKYIGEDTAELRFNTAVAKMMEFVNAVQKIGAIGKTQLERFLIVLSPYAPHIAEEIWQLLGNEESVTVQKWPEYDEQLTVEQRNEFIVQVNGKVRAKISFDSDVSEQEAKELALAEENVQKWLGGKEIKKTIFVPGKLISFVV